MSDSHPGDRTTRSSWQFRSPSGTFVDYEDTRASLTTGSEPRRLPPASRWRTARRVALVMAALAALVYLSSQGLLGAYFPATTVAWAFIPLSIGLSLGLTAWLARVRPRPPQIAALGTVERWLLLYPFALLGLAAAMFMVLKGAAGVANRVVGTPGDKDVTVSSKGYHPASKSGCRHALYFEELRDLGGGQFPLCVSANAYEQSEAGTRYRLRVRRSWLGISVE